MKTALITGISGQDASNLNRIIKEVQPDEVYNLAAQSHVAVSFDTPEYSADVNGLLNVVTKYKDYLVTIRGPSRPLKRLKLPLNNITTQGKA